MEIVFLNESNVSTLDTNKKIFIFGAGAFAVDSMRFISRYGQKPFAFVVDDEYYHENQKIDDIPIIPFSRFLSENAKNDSILIWGVASPGRFKQFAGQDLKELYLIWDWTWKFDEATYKQYEAGYNETLKMFHDDLSPKTMKDFLYAKRTGDATEDIKNSIDGTYFNNLTHKFGGRGGVFVDCGAYDGDTLAKYLNFVQDKNAGCIAFEADERNFKALKDNYKDFPNIECIYAGVWDTDGELAFYSGGAMGSHAENKSDLIVPARSIDSVVKTRKVSFIKMDVEGAELKALLGAKNTITRDKPILAISVYHLPEDLATIPKQIREFDKEGDYKYYLRHHGVMACELVFYAIPKI